MKKKFSELNIKPKERKAILEFSRRAKKELGQELVTTLLFGSILTSKYNKDSDIDIFVLVRHQTISVLKVLGNITADIWYKYDVFLSPVMYDEFEQKRNFEMQSPFFESVYNKSVKI